MRKKGKQKPSDETANQPSLASNKYGKPQPEYMSLPAASLTHSQIRDLQSELRRSIQERNHLERELNVRSIQVEQMEDNLRLVADQSKTIGIRAMEQEDNMQELKRALDLKSKQLRIYRKSKADELPLNEMTVLPMHLRGKFSEFLRKVLYNQKIFFEKALLIFVNENISDAELNYQGLDISRDNLILEVRKIGNYLAVDYMSELEMRLNGTFSADQSMSALFMTPSTAEVKRQQILHMEQSIQKQMEIQKMEQFKMQKKLERINDSNNKKMKKNDAFSNAMSTIFKGKNKKKKRERSSSPANAGQMQGNAVQVLPSYTNQQTMQLPVTNLNESHSASNSIRPLSLHQQSNGMSLSLSLGGHHPLYPYQSQPNQVLQQPPYNLNLSIVSASSPRVQPPQSSSYQAAQNAYSFQRSKTSVVSSVNHVANLSELHVRGNSQKTDSTDDNNEYSGTFLELLGTETPARTPSVRVHNGHNSISDEIKTDLISGDKQMASSAYNFNDIDEDADDDEVVHNADIDDDEDIDPELAQMQAHFRQLTQQHISAVDRSGSGNDAIAQMLTQFVTFKKAIERPSYAPFPFRVPDKTNAFIELRDMLEALPFDLARAILHQQTNHFNDRIKDVLIQRGCWPIVRFAKDNRHVCITHSMPFNDILMKVENYMKSEKNRQIFNMGIIPTVDENDLRPQISTAKNAGMMLLGSLDPQKTTGYRLHQITAIVRNRNEAKHTITALNFRVGRLWNINEHECDIINDSLDFFQSLDSPSTMLVLGANTSEKCCLIRELTRIISTTHNMRTALVDTRSTVGGFTQSPLETGQAVRFYVNSITNQYNTIDATRSIYPQVVVVDEVLYEEDISIISRLQSEGISVIAGTNMHSLEALLGHPVFCNLLPPQNRLNSDGMNIVSNSSLSLSLRRPMSTRASRKSARNLLHLNQHQSQHSFSSMSPHLLILEMNYEATEIKMYKNVPKAVKSIQNMLTPDFTAYKLNWKDYRLGDSGDMGYDLRQFQQQEYGYIGGPQVVSKMTSTRL